MATHSALRTPLCDLLGMRYPIIQAPMAGGYTTPELVAEVANAGGLGMAALGRTPVDEIGPALDAVRERTEGVFGANFMVAAPATDTSRVPEVQRFLDPFRAELGLPPGQTDLHLPAIDVSRQLDIALEFGVPVVSFAFGSPAPLIERVHSAGALAMVMVTTVDEAQVATASGADVIIAQGLEAGGHRSILDLQDDAEAGGIGTLALIPQVVDAVSVPVVAAGGIMDGRGIVAALALGAQGVQLGTRFLGARESGAHLAYRQRLLDATGTATVVTRAMTGRPARVITNRLTRAFQSEGQAPLGWGLQSAAASDIYQAAHAQGEMDLAAVYAGQGVGLFRDGQPAGAIVDELVAEAVTILDRLSG